MSDQHPGYDPEYPYVTPPQAPQSDQEAWFASTRVPPPDGPPWVHATRPKADADGAAITGFVLAFFFPVIGFILGAVSQGQAKRRGMRQSSLATAAMWIGAALTVIEVILVIVIIAAGSKTGQACDISNPAYPYC